MHLKKSMKMKFSQLNSDLTMKKAFLITLTGVRLNVKMQTSEKCVNRKFKILNKKNTCPKCGHIV